MTVQQLLRQMDARELTDWIAFWQREPWGDERADLRSGIVAAAATNVWAGRGRQATPRDFMPRCGDEDTPRQPPELMQGLFRRAAKAFKAKQDDG